MRQRPFDLALSEDRLRFLLALPYPQVLGQNFLIYGISKFADTGLVQHWPELHHRHGTVKQHVKRAVIGIIKTLQINERIALPGIGSGRGSVGLSFMSPESTAVRQIVKLVEQHAAIPGGIGGICSLKRLPRRQSPAAILLLPETQARPSPCRPRLARRQK